MIPGITGLSPVGGFPNKFWQSSPAQAWATALSLLNRPFRGAALLLSLLQGSCASLSHHDWAGAVANSVAARRLLSTASAMHTQASRHIATAQQVPGKSTRSYPNASGPLQWPNGVAACRLLSTAQQCIPSNPTHNNSTASTRQVKPVTSQRTCPAPGKTADKPASQ